MTSATQPPARRFVILAALAAVLLLTLAGAVIYALAVIVPNVPPIGKTVKGFESNAWFGLFGPAKMQAEVAQRLYEAAKKAIEDPSFVKRLEMDGGTPSSMTPQQFSEFVAHDVQRWAKVIKYSGAVAE